MAISVRDLPDEIYVLIVEECSTQTLLALARTSRRFSRISQPRLYRHIYFRYIGIQKPKVPPRFTSDGWSCAACGYPCSDAVFNDEEKQPAPTQCVDLPKLADTLSASSVKRGLVQTLRIDVQNSLEWLEDVFNNNAGSKDLELGPKLWRWVRIRRKREKIKVLLEEAIMTVTEALCALPCSRALFTTSCFDDTYSTPVSDNPRLIQTMGMPLPFMLLLPKYVVHDEAQEKPTHPRGDGASDHLQYLLHSKTRSRFEFCEPLRIDDSQHPPQVIKSEFLGWLPEVHYLTFLDYIGPGEELEPILGAPGDFDSLGRWLDEKPREEFLGDAIRPVLLRTFRRELWRAKHARSRGFSNPPGILVLGDTRLMDFVRCPAPKTSQGVPSSPMASVLLVPGLFC